jgi:transcriptional regulator with GAF, ATPase, and Fis domain
LRARENDITSLARHFLDAACTRFARPGLQFTASQLQQLDNYDWPGNVRELRNVIERAVISSPLGSFRLEIPQGESMASPSAIVAAASDQESRVIPDKEMYRRRRDNMLTALKLSGGRIYGAGGAAELLGLRPSTLCTRVKKLGLK